MAKADDTGAAFARDLGYLDAFFDKLEAHGTTLGGAAGERLRTLIGEERVRWGEIRALVRGEVPAKQGGSGSEAAPGLRGGHPGERPTRETRQTELTVGSLRPRK